MSLRDRSWFDFFWLRKYLRVVIICHGHLAKAGPEQVAFLSQEVSAYVSSLISMNEITKMLWTTCTEPGLHKYIFVYFSYTV